MPTRRPRQWAVLLVASLALSCADPTEGPRRVVLVTIDTLRADALGVYGNRGGHTPHLDELAARSIVFENAYAPIATTFPSHASMLTGIYPREHGVRWNGNFLEERFDTLAERFRDAGYATGAFVAYRAMVNSGGLGQGFETVSDPLGNPASESMPRPGEEVNAMAIDWLRERRGEPFFLWVHYFEPHMPYPVTPYARRLMGAYDGPLAQGVGLEVLRAMKGKWADAPAERAALRALYSAQVHEVDERVGDLLAVLRDEGIDRNAVFVFTADHGQLLGEHGTFGHGSILWEGALHVPLLVFDPDLPARRVTERVGLVDLAPTLLDLLGLDPLADVSGRSLVPALRGEPLPPGVYFAEARAVSHRPDLGERVAVYAGRHKLVSYPDEVRLYDLEADPLERDAIDASTEPEVLPLLERLAREHRQSGAGASTRRGDGRTLEALRQLGYVE